MDWKTFCKVAAQYDADQKKPIDIVWAKWGDSGFNKAHGFDSYPPVYEAETQAQITAYFQRNLCAYIEHVAAKHGIDLQAEMRKSGQVESYLSGLRK